MFADRVFSVVLVASGSLLFQCGPCSFW